MQNKLSRAYGTVTQPTIPKTGTARLPEAATEAAALEAEVEARVEAAPAAILQRHTTGPASSGSRAYCASSSANSTTRSSACASWKRGLSGVETAEAVHVAWAKTLTTLYADIDHLTGQCPKPAETRLFDGDDRAALRDITRRLGMPTTPTRYWSRN